MSLPGFGLPLTVRKELKEKFPIAVLHEDYVAPMLAVREYTMMEVMNRLTDKPNWDAKIFDGHIAAKWKEEALNPNDTHVDISTKMVDWCIEELKCKADFFKQTRCIETLDGVWKSDSIVSEDLKVALKHAAAPLENIPEKDKDWHPGSNEQVLDLVHPSMYPLVYGQSRILPNHTCGVDDCMTYIGKGQILEASGEHDEVPAEWSRTFQWLPADFETPPDTEDVKITSYINNLRPDQHQELYTIIAKIVVEAIPLWNRSLASLESKLHIPPRLDRHGFYGFAEDGKPDPEEGEDPDDFDERLDEWRDNREIIQPESKEFEPPEKRLNDSSDRHVEARNLRYVVKPDLQAGVDLRKDYGKLQVIVKLANIHLTPDKPNYEGGTWHVDGQANESICATALYYYNSENISESLLGFRQQVDSAEDLPYDQYDHRAVETIFGFENEGPTIQDLGKVVTREGRLLTFPNVMQHRVYPFRLADPTRPGHRKILALFLVDPHLRIISTANVPPQQKAWWRELVEDKGALKRVPREIADSILDKTDFPVALEKAKLQRLELMDERKKFVVAHNDKYESLNVFSLCEH